MSKKLNLERVLENSGCAAPMSVADAIEAFVKELIEQNTTTVCGPASFEPIDPVDLKTFTKHLSKLGSG